jgi:D-lactate dehydrogenase
LLSHLQVLITPHAAFLTHEALGNIASTTITNIEEYLQDKQLTNELHPKPQK